MKQDVEVEVEAMKQIGWIVTGMLLAAVAAVATQNVYMEPWTDGGASSTSGHNRAILLLGSTNDMPSAGTNGIVMKDGTALGGMPTDSAGIFADGTATELKGIDEAGNVTTLTPHTFRLFHPDPSLELPWSFHSENAYVGKRVEVDMFKLARLVERLTGERLIYLEDIPRKQWDRDEPMPRWMSERIERD